MKLELIKDEVCPHCKAIVVAESCRSRHCNGQGFEERTFACGHVLEWSPNFEQLRIKTPCPNSEAEVKLAASRDVATTALLTFLRDLKVDNRWKFDVIRYLPQSVIQQKHRVKDFPKEE